MRFFKRLFVDCLECDIASLLAAALAIN